MNTQQQPRGRGVPSLRRPTTCWNNTHTTGLALEGALSPSISIPKAVMLMHRTATRMVYEPGRDAGAMEATEALEAGHGDADLELLEADGALGRVDAVLLGGEVGEHAGAARRLARRGLAAVGIAAVGRDADGDVGLAEGLVVGERAGRQRAVADGTFVLLGDLGRRRRRRWEAAALVGLRVGRAHA